MRPIHFYIFKRKCLCDRHIFDRWLSLRGKHSAAFTAHFLFSFSLSLTHSHLQHTHTRTLSHTHTCPPSAWAHAANVAKKRFADERLRQTTKWFGQSGGNEANFNLDPFLISQINPRILPSFIFEEKTNRGFDCHCDSLVVDRKHGLACHTMRLRQLKVRRAEVTWPSLAPLRRSTMASNAHPPSHQRPRLSPTYVCVSVNNYIMTRQYSYSVNLCVSRGREKRIETSGRMRQTATFQERETRDRNIVLQGWWWRQIYELNDTTYGS